MKLNSSIITAIGVFSALASIASASPVPDKINKFIAQAAKAAAAQPASSLNQMDISPYNVIQSEISNWLAQATPAQVSLYSQLIGSIQPPGPLYNGLSLLYSARVSTGVQIYNCNATTLTYPAGASSVQATLVDQFTNASTVYYNFTAPIDGKPEWTFLLDNSYVIEAPVIKAPSPDGSIPWVLLHTTSSSASGFFSTVQQIIRYNTQGGIAPSGSCTAGQTAQVPYTAWYDFYAPDPTPTPSQISSSVAVAGAVSQWLSQASVNDSALYNTIIHSVTPAGPLTSGLSLLYSANVGDGIQVYTCNSTTLTYPAASSSVIATLIDPITFAPTVFYNFTAQQGGSPQWFFLLDGSYVIEAPQKKFPSPDGSIPWVLLQTASASTSGYFSTVKEIVRFNTLGGVAPSGPCISGQQVGVPYSASYNFYGPGSAPVYTTSGSVYTSSTPAYAASTYTTAAYTTPASSVYTTPAYTTTTQVIYSPTTQPIYTQTTTTQAAYVPTTTQAVYAPTTTPSYQPTPSSVCHFGGYRCADIHTLQQCGYGAGNVLQWESFQPCQTGTVCTIKGNFVGCDFPSN